MSTTAVLEEAVALAWDELPDLVGEEWGQVERELLVLLRRLDAGEDIGEVQNQIVKLFQRFPDAYLKLAEYIADLAPKLKGETPTLFVPRDRHIVVPVYYATDRNTTGDPKPEGHYGTDRGNLTFGLTHVSIPDDYRMGKLPKPRWWRLEFRANPDKYVVLLTLEPYSRERFVVEAANAGKRADTPEALVFVHGYNVNFNDAIRRAAQIAYDLEFAGIPMVYSWPSVANMAEYFVDETNIRLSRFHFQEFMALCRAELGLHAILVVAHSMGSQLIAETLPNEKAFTGKAALRQIVFAAPDIDAETFEKLAATFANGQVERCTLYASSEDYALKASKKFHGYLRAGDSGEGLIVINHIDTIDATAVDTSLLGHAYYGDNRSILSDMFTLIREGHGPESRFGLRKLERSGRHYWAFRP